MNSCSSRAELQALLESVVAKRANVTPAKFDSDLVETPRAKLAAAAQVASSLTSSVQVAAFTAQGVEDRVRGALEIYNRAKEAREYVETTLRLRTSINAIYDAIDTKNWERAAAAAKTALDLPPEILRSEFACRMVPSTDLHEEPEVSLKKACDGMAELFLKEFDIACAARDTQKLTRWFKLLPQINHQEEGIQRYARFVAGIVAGQSRNLLAEASRDNESLYGIAMARLFESIASILDQHSQLVETYYGDKMGQVISVIQNEVDSQAGLIIDTWYDERRIEHLLEDIKGYQYPGLVTQLGIPTQGYCDINLDETLLRLAELDLMLNRWQLYCDFLTRWPSEATIEASNLRSKTDEVLRPTFDKLAIFVFRRSVERATENDVLPEPAKFSPDAPLVSSMVDEITMTLSTLINQAMGTASATVEQQVVSSLLRVLQSDWIKIVELKLVKSPSKFATYVYLNDLKVSAGYVEKIAARAKDNYQEGEKVLDSFAERFRRSTDEALAEACKGQCTILEASVKSICGQIFRGDYLLSPTEPESTKGAEFVRAWDKLIAPLRDPLHPDVFNQIIAYGAKMVAQLLEKWIMSLEAKVNELGVIALDRDLSRIIATVSQTQYSLRDHFAKVARIVNYIETGEGDVEDPERVGRILV